MIDLRCQDVAAMLAELAAGVSPLIHADPPWKYSNGSRHAHGAADRHYGGLSNAQIAEHLAASARVAPRNGYLAVWCTFPKLREWFKADDPLQKAGWFYISGGAWGKADGRNGVGYHFLGDAELVLLYKKGKPRPLQGPSSNLWLADRGSHSEKPQPTLIDLITMAVPLGGLVVDLYAGESASMARACRITGRSYIGAELDPKRHATALTRLSQQGFSEPVPVAPQPDQLSLLDTIGV